MKIGLLGGTFDPVHRAHLALAETALFCLKMTRVIFVPAGQPYFKTDSAISPAEHRINMLRLALDGKPYFKLSLLEIERAGPSYAVDTIADLKKGLAEDDELFFILGWDALQGLARWHEPARLIDMCRLVTAPRPGFAAPDIEALERDIPGICERVLFMDGPEMNISASEIRRCVQQGQEISHLVPKPVAEYIEQHGLYR